ncbi:V/A-type H+-transporting ATPase subunit D [Saccharicrinis carchari]|uniref:V/A-type H+-transporting ATPase subunit D n=1 Tax=Saccharicrinis carchari TaxID=1168039 RepID=A0A521C416_SACCC|nr:V-type ATP synthase subunit D [Saccharicrinis carchari]SMO54144.1 V/A-type H+-transporting ATPase subunit D [Saccharicrinis carchari]
MAIKFQYNKTSQQLMDKQLKVRERALPTLQNKEAALRIEVKKARERAQELEHELEAKLADLDNMSRLWGEFDMNAITVEDVELANKRIAGVQTPELVEVIFKKEPFALFSKPVWFLDGVKIVESLAKLGIEREVYIRKMELLDRARKKTTQKVNLYEKVQIPGYKDAILKIKRFLEDEENLSKAAQKIIKNRQEEMEVQL